MMTTLQYSISKLCGDYAVYAVCDGVTADEPLSTHPTLAGARFAVQRYAAADACRRSEKGLGR